MLIVCLDLEGVLIPEVWVEFARRSGIASLTRTTRDEPDYDKLMRFRLGTLAEQVRTGERTRDQAQHLAGHIVDADCLALATDSGRSSGDETVLRGNAAGLVQVALDALVLANSGKTGSHVHIDAASNADYAEGGLVIGVIDAPWA